MKGKTGLIVVVALLVIASMLAMVGIVAAQTEPISGQVDKYNAQGQIVTLWLDINSSDYVTVHITDGAPSLDYYNFSDISPLLSRNGYSAGNTYSMTVAMFCNRYERDINGTLGSGYSNTYQNDIETNGTFVFDNSLKTLPMMNLTLCPTLTLTPTPTSKPTDLHQEVGDAIYCTVAWWKLGWFIDHAGIYYKYTGGNPNDFNNHLMFDQQGAGSRRDTLQKFKGDQDYLKSHTVRGGLDKATRWKIVNTAWALKNASKPYVRGSEFTSKPLVPDWSDNYWDGTIDDIEGFRCDGYVEYAYEKNGVNVQDGSIARPVGRRIIGCTFEYPYQGGVYCYSNKDLISHYGFRHCTPTSQMKSLVPSIWEPPTNVKIIGCELNEKAHTFTVTWKPSEDEHSGLWGYYYELDRGYGSTIPPSNWKKWTNHKFSPDRTSWTTPKLEVGKHYWFHIRAVDKAGNMAETFHQGFYIPCTNDSDCKKCEKCNRYKECIKIEPCCGNQECETDSGENEVNCPQDCPPGPGNDHPDETYDVSTPKITLDSPDSSTAPEIAILSNGFATSTASLFASLNEPTALVDVDFSPDIVKDYPVLIIPAGGLYGLDSLPSFKSNLEQYIKDGGTLIVFSQQHGYEFDVVPGDLGGYGWTEDQSCHHSSVGISTYHPILSGQDSVTSAVTVDGYFTKYPENATILLSRTKNGMPAMLMYEYGNGTVIASTIYTDWAYTHYQATRDGKNLVRDMIAWAKDRTEISEYGRTDTVNIRINRTIPKPDIPEYTEYELGAVVNVPINITNPFNVTVDNVSFSIYDPDMEIDYVNVSITIPPNETRTVDFTYGDTDKEGFHFVLYSLCIGESCIEIEDLAYFFGINVTITPSYRINYTLLDPDKNIITNESVVFEENVSVAELPTNVSILNFPYTNPSKLGIWRFEYEILDVNDILIESGVKKFAVSKYAENPGGWVYQGKDITYGVSSDSDEYACGSNATFTIHIWNNGDIDKNITVYWEWIHEGRNLLGTFLVPAHDSISIPYTYNVYPRWGIWRFWTYFYDDGKYLGESSVGGSVFSPTVNIDIETDKTEYAIGENVLILSSLKNKQSVGHNISVTVKTLDPDNKKIYEDCFDANLSAGASANKTLDFTLPADSRGGIYIVTAEAYEKGNKIGSNSAYFVISTSNLLRLSFDKPNKVYGIRQNLSLLINVSNTGSSVWSSWINTTIPAFSFFDSKNISLNPDESKEIEYKDFLISTDFAPGKHNVLVNLSYDNTTKKDNFFIPCSDLIIEFDKKDVAAGENLSFNISNTGGVDTDFNCSFKLVDWKGKLMYEDVVEDIVLSLKNKTISFDIHNQSVNGSYYLLVSCKDIKTGKETELAALCDVSGLKADLTSDTERKVYFENENVSILTNITNLNGEIVNGTLNLKIVRVSMPTETERALARATAKLSASHNSSTAEEEESQIEEAPLPSPLPSANFSTDLSLYNLVATARAASPLANFTPTPEPENEIGEVPIEEPSPSLPPVNLTPIPEPEPEEEPNETYKPITVKLSDIIIGNETVWKDETKILNGDLIVNSTGNLTLINTTVIMNCSSDGQYHIAVQNGGEMHIFDSNITAKNTNYEYYFQVKSGAKFAMRDSELRECGYAWGTNGYLAGLWINTNDTIIVNNSITNNYYGIILRESSNSNIANNTVSSNNGDGIFLAYSSGNTIANNTVSNNGDGIFLAYSSGNTIANNTVSSNRNYGIYLRFSNSNTIANNTVSSNNEDGIFLYSSNSNTIANNIVSNNGDGIYLYSSNSNTIANNTVSSNNGYGIHLHSSSGNTIANNTVSSNNEDGIFFLYSNSNTIANNTVSSNRNRGIYLGDSSGNLIYNNYFNNLINAYDGEQNTWIITKTFADDGNIIGGPWLGGNYWSDYEGEDEDGDKLGDTLLPYNCSGMIKEGGDYLPLVMPLQPGEVLWEENITINLAEGETKNIISEVPASVFKDVIGKQKLSSTFYSNTTQIINISDPFFYVTPKNTSLTMETDKRVYKPNETVLIYGEVKNHASIAMDYNLSIKKDSVEIFNDSFTLATDETRYYATNTSADASFTLEGTVDGVVVLDSLSVDSPGINASIIAPDVVGIKDFDVGVLIENMGNISADLNVSLDGKRWNITVPEGESQLLETTMNTSRNMTITVIISGDVNETIQKEIICGESAKINITPEPTYLEGEVEIPFTINNTGVRDSEFNATFSISSTGNQTITKHFFVPKGENITDCVSFNLTKGAHLLRYTSPFETVNTTINVLSPPEFVVTSIHPAELNFTIGENVTLVFTVKNVGGSEGEAALTLSITDFEDTNRTWIIAGAEEDISFYFSIPDDLEEKSYKGIYVLAGTRSEFTFFVQGANISVDASLDKSMYAEGDTAVLTLELTNECELDLDLYSRVKFNEYDSVQNFTLAGSGTETLIFYVPANFSGDTKVLYTVYMDSGRALYINSIYIYEELPDAPLRLFTDKDVYNMGEEVTIYIVDVTGTDMLNLTAPNFSYNDTISGPTTLEFTLPALRSGTYYIEYSFGNFSSTHPFDVRGYFARILEASLDKEEYISGNEMKLEMNIEANRDVSGLLKTRIYDPEENLIDEFEMNKRLIAGENKIELCRTLSTDKSGIHAIVYGFSAELSGDSSTTLVSGAEYFDAESMGLCGDVAPYPDCNGIVDMGDVILLLNNVSYLEDPRYALCNYWAGDCRCTGVRDMGDVILLLNYVSYPEDPRYVLDCC